MLSMLLPTTLFDAVARSAVMALNVGNNHNEMGSVIGISRSVMSMGMVIGPLVFGFTMDSLSINSVFQIRVIVEILVNIRVIYLLYK